jgi:dipeptidyl-peptidase-4
MKKFASLFFVLLFVASFARAQEKLLTIDDIFDPQKRVQFGGRPAFFQWSKDNVSFLQPRPSADGMKIVKVNALTGAEVTFIDGARITAVLATLGVSADDAKSASNSPPNLNEKETAALYTISNDIFLFDIASGAMKRLTNNKEEELEADFSPDGKMVSFVRGMNLFVLDLATLKEKQLTFDGSEKILNGHLDWVYEEELYGRGNKRGYWWSPDSTSIAFLRLDETKVPKFVVVDHIPTDQKIEDGPYPQAGDPNPTVKLGVVNVGVPAQPIGIGRVRLPNVITRRLPPIAIPGPAKLVDLSKYPAEDLLISRVAWSPDSKAVLFQAQNREQTFLDLNAYKPSTAVVSNLFRETSNTWVEVIDNPTFLKDGTAIWQSGRRGFRHLYHYSNDGKLIRQITKGDWEVRNFFGVDEKNGYAYFSAAGEDGVWIGDQIYRIRLDGTGLTELTNTPGNHSASFNSNFTHFVDSWSDINTPPQSRLFKPDGSFVRTINENKVDALAQYKLGKPEFLRVKTRDGFDMEAMMIKPPDFDPTKKYPVFAYTYSGPHAPSVVNRWSGARYMWHQMLAQKGYIIWICDNRTASGKGNQSEWNVYQNFGELELRDLEDGFSYLKSLSFVDGERIGMWGWSFGGYMTSYAMTHSKTFKAGIAGGLVGDWSLYDSIYTERYMRTPQNNQTGYEKSSVIGAAKNLNGSLLILHGAIDDNVHMQNPIKLAFELQKSGRQFEMMVYPTQRHGVTNPLQVKHMYQLMTDFVLRNL